MRVKFIKPGHRRFLFGAASALILSVAITGTAHASESCDAISGANYNNANVQQGDNTLLLNTGQQFAFDPGDTLTLTITVPPSTRVNVFVQGAEVTVDNSGNPAGSVTETRTLVIPESTTGGGDSGPVAIQITSSSGGGTVNVDFGCTNAAVEPDPDPDPDPEPEPEAAIDPRRFGAQIDNTVQSIVPGGANGGNLFDDFGVPNNPFFPNGARLSDFICEELQAAKAALAEARAERSEKFNAMREAARESADAIQAHAAAQTALENAEKSAREADAALTEAENDRDAKLKAFEDAVDENEDTLDAIARRGFDESFNPATILAVRAAIAEARDNRDAARAALEASNVAHAAALEASNAAQSRLDSARAADEQLRRARFEAGQRAREAEQALAEADQALADAEAELERVKAECETNGEFTPQGGFGPKDEGPQGDIGYFSTQRGSIFAGLEGSVIPAAYPRFAANDLSFLPAIFTGNTNAGRSSDVASAALAVPGYGAAPVRRLAGGFSLANARASAEAGGGELVGLLGDKRLNLWINGGVTFHFDNSSIGQEGETITVSTGVSYLIDPRVNIGLAGRFGHTDRSGATGGTVADTWSLGAFTQVKLPDNFALSAMIAYSLVDINADTIQGALTASGETEAKSLAGQLSLSKPFEVGGWTLSPNGGVSFVNIDRDAFIASDGTQVAASRSTQISARAGFDASTRFDIERANGGTITVVPRFGLSGFYNLGRFDPLVGSNGEEIRAEGFGLVANAGMALQFAGGASLGLNSSLSGLTSDRKNLSVSARFSLPF